MRNATLTLTNTRDREASTPPADDEVIAGGRSLSRSATGEVCICEKVWLNRIHVVTHPTNHAEMLGRVNVTHKTMKFAVTLGRPSANICSEVTNGTEQVETTKTCSIKNFHENFSSNGLKTAHLTTIRKRPPRRWIAIVRAACRVDLGSFLPWDFGLSATASTSHSRLFALREIMWVLALVSLIPFHGLVFGEGELTPLALNVRASRRRRSLW